MSQTTNLILLGMWIVVSALVIAKTAKITGRQTQPANAAFDKFVAQMGLPLPAPMGALVWRRLQERAQVTQRCGWANQLWLIMC